MTKRRPAKDLFLPPKQKKFVPSKASEETIVRSAPNFLSPHRVNFDIGEQAILDKFNHLVLDAGIPLVISGYLEHPKWNPDLFTDEGTRKEFQRYASGKRIITVREEGKNGGDIKMPFDDFWKAIKTEGCPLYGKDLTCGAKWERALQSVLPPFFVYRGIGDLNKRSKGDDQKVSSVNMMVYIGTGGTSTAGHYDHGGAIGQNIMVGGQGSSLWFVFRPCDLEKVRELWRENGHEFDQASFCIPLSKLQDIDVDVFIIEQKIGDLIILPPMAPHQVLNRGGLTQKIAWNRITPYTLHHGIHELLPFYREICEPEQYKFKNSTQAALIDRVAMIKSVRSGSLNWYFGSESFCHEFLILARLFAFIIWSDSWSLGRIRGHPWVESVGEVEPPRVIIDKAPLDGSLALPYCRLCQCDIWNLHVQCNEGHGARQPYILCIDCYALGRGCLHRATSLISFHQLFPLEDAIKIYRSSAKAWNSCNKLKDVKGFLLLSLDWENEVIKNQLYTPVDIAFARYFILQPLRRKSYYCCGCHGRIFNTLPACCGQVFDKEKRTRTCKIRLCEQCLAKYHQISWAKVFVQSDAPFCCFKCLEYSSKPLPKKKALISYNENPQQDPHNRGSAMDDGFPSFFEFAKAGKKNGIEPGSIRGKQARLFALSPQEAKG
ncbi:hypothetical protein EMPS_07774 [Entomortierella parvispora]|uniref:JmjC domain-containing protein n=1 Tax=Entomortierella parvispora TaxID=205924 RepID=A0A9P3LYG4_9FUNG|nr:hypothetical protein EMPS_07774 [Entomortierella parvispora]